ncbi:MAG: PAS domain S-box protein [Bacteroidota bacterium]|nr:PAS domain S-box protein [Bacteroidota bacterium]
MDSIFAFLFDQSTDFFCISNTDGTIVKTNAALRAVLGYTEEELVGQKANYFFHPADIKRLDELLMNLPHKNNIFGYESRIKAKNGRYYNIKWSVTLTPGDSLVYAIGVNLTEVFESSGPNDTTNKIQHIIQSFNEGFFIMNGKWQVTSFNPAFQAITGLKNEQLVNINFRELITFGITDEIFAKFKVAIKGNISSQIQYFNNYLKRWLRVNIYPYQGEVVVFVRDITRIKTQQLILALEKNVLELNASSHQTLPQTVKALLLGIEEIYPDMICSVLEVDDAQEKLYHIAAPRLPTAYCEAIDGTTIGPKAGSCGTAAYHRSQIIVNDIATNPLWDDYRQFVLPYGIKACWSTPIISSNSSRVLATFAVYYTENREPKSTELQLIERTTNILRVLIENKRNQDHVKDQNRRLQEIAAISSHEIRRPVATILGLVNLFDKVDLDNPLNKEIINHIDITAKELDAVIHTIVEKTIYLKGEE